MKIKTVYSRIILKFFFKFKKFQVRPWIYNMILFTYFLEIHAISEEIKIKLCQNVLKSVSKSL